MKPTHYVYRAFFRDDKDQSYIPRNDLEQAIIEFVFSFDRYLYKRSDLQKLKRFIVRKFKELSKEHDNIEPIEFNFIESKDKTFIWTDLKEDFPVYFLLSACYLKEL